MRRLLSLSVLMLSWLALTIGCRKESREPQTTVRFVVPSNFPAPNYSFEGNPLTVAGFDLGHRLFYENALSVDKSVNCGTCHQQFAAFANLDHSVSHGVNDCFGTRNAPPIFNLAWQKEFMWDGGVHHIEVSGLNALLNPCEMGNTLDQIVEVLSHKAPYPELFNKAFGSPEITSQRILKALTQFTGMMISANSRYDKIIRKEGNLTFSADEQAGFTLFKSKCASCHPEPFFTDFSYRSNGLDLNPADRGRDSITQDPNDQGKFRVPSLRNVELSRPYMHDGRFFTLNDVLEHYNSGVQPHDHLDPLLRNDGIKLSISEQRQIISFLKTLTDYDFIQNKLFAEL